MNQIQEKTTQIKLSDGITVDKENRCIRTCEGVEIAFDTILHLAYGIIESSERLVPASTDFEFFQSMRDAGVTREVDGSIKVTLPFAGDTPT